MPSIGMHGWSGKRNSSSNGTDEEKIIWSSESSKLLPVWYWAVK